MANDREDKYEGQEESEYHFSDESEYELEPELEPTETEAPKPKASSFKDTALSGISRYRRMIIGVVVFFVLLFIVYKMIMPTTTPPATDFAANTPPKVAAPAPKPAALPTPSPAQQVSVPIQQPNPLAAPAIVPASAPAPVADVPAQVVPVQAAPPIQTPPPAFPTQANVPPPPVPAASTPAAPVPVPVTTVATPPVGVNERLSNLEQQNSRVMTMMETEYSQKLSESQAQNLALQNKVRELNTRLANMETTLNQLTQALLNKQQQPTAVVSAPAAMIPPPPLTRPTEPRLSYTVQAIIPGRAWLKSEAGDTVTVAEGDILKDYGRITKIDPYDGIVQIDVGNKTITLSYGSGGD